MSLEELDNLDTPPVNAVDDFEAALAATASDVQDDVVTSVIADVQAVTGNDMAVVPDQVETEIDSLSEAEIEEEENDKIVVDLTPGTKKETKLETKKQETKEKKPRNYKLKVRLEGEPSTSTKPIEPSTKPIEVAPEQEQKPKRAPPKRKQTEQEVKPVEPSPPPKEEIKEKIRVVKLVKCDKCGKSITSKSLKYSHKCGEEKVIINEPKTTKTIEYETEAPAPEANILPPELNTRILQRIKEKEKRFSKLIENAF
jgi:hypothetical protein